MNRRAAILLGLILAGPAHAQDEKPTCRLRFLAVGNAPPWREEWRDGIRYEVPPAPGTVPPRNLLLEGPRAGGEFEEFGSVVLELGRVSGEVEVPAGRAVRLREKSAERPWLELPAPGEDGFLVILRRGGDGRSWFEARAQVVADDFPAGGLRFVNASDRTLAVTLGEAKVALVSGKVWTTRLLAGAPTGFELRSEAAGRPLLRQSLEQGPGERTLAVLSAADQPDRPPFKLTLLRELVRKRLPAGGGAN